MDTRMIKNIKGFGMILFVVVAMLLAFSGGVHAEGSVDLTENGGNRAYTEWQGNTTTGLVRQQIIKCYANAGETIYFGSSITKSNLGSDIAVTDPNGTTTKINNTEADGLIANRAQESGGPKQLSADGNGYPAHSITVDTTGVYTFEFHSKENNGGVNPKPLAIDSDNAFKSDSNGQNTGTVAAWDVTVAADNVPQSGRVYTDCLFLNMGNNGASLYAKIYVVTHDGFIYETNFNGMDPYGFVFFGNNKGLIHTKTNKTNQSAYHSGIATENELKTLKDSNGNGLGYYNPKQADDVNNKTFKLFFNDPSKTELPTTIKPTQAAAANLVTDSFKFNNGGAGIAGGGGDFTFDLPEAKNYGSYQIEINCTPNIDNVDPESWTSTNTVVLSGVCSGGTNSVHWDGKGVDGNPLPATEEGYSYTAKVTIKGGEYHFLLFDVENNPNGIINTLLNQPTNTTLKSTDVFYNNALINGKADGADHQLKPLDSKDGASKFNSKAGDYTALDLWTYSPSGMATTQFKLLDKNESGYITGFVFEDENKDGAFLPNDGDFPLSGATVTITGNDGFSYTCTTKSDGTYVSPLIKKGSYTVAVTPPDGVPYSCTTNNETQTVALESGTQKAEDVGYGLPRGSITFNKVDGDGQPLQGATFTLNTVNSDGSYKTIAEVVSDENGQVTFDNIKYLKDGSNYTLLEKYAPAGYRKDTTHWTVYVDGSGSTTLTDGTGNAVDTITNICEVSVDKTAKLKEGQWDNRIYTIDVYAAIPTGGAEGETLKATSIKDTIDPRFDVVDDNGQVLAENATVSDGTLKKDAAGNWFVEWIDQDLTQAETTAQGWHKTITVKAKDNYIGGNAVTTNVTADHASSVTTAVGTFDFPQPTVNVKADYMVKPLEDTIFLGTKVNLNDDAVINAILGDTFTKYGLTKDNFTITWYTDEACTIEATPEQIENNECSADQTFYAKVNYTGLGQSTDGSLANTTDTTGGHIAGDATTANADSNLYKTATNKIHVVKGQIQINKSIDKQYTNIKKINANQTFVYKIEYFESGNVTGVPTQTYYETINFDANGIQTEDSRLISELKMGAYRVTEETEWAAKYELQDSALGENEYNAVGANTLDNGYTFLIGTKADKDTDGKHTFSGLLNAKSPNTDGEWTASDKYTQYANGERTQVSFTNNAKQNWNLLSDTAAAINVFNK